MTSSNSIPATLVAGDSWAWADAAAFVSHPPEDWQVTVTLRPVTGGTGLAVDAVPAPPAYTFAVAASATAPLPPGEWYWTVLATHRTQDARARLASGRFAVLPDPAATTGDRRSVNERTLAAINAALEGRATKDADSYTIEGRSISRTPIADLLRLQALYERRVAAERNPNGGLLQYRRVRFS